ncbi:MAG TPA: BLUF domain-containing protein [Burkholderiaceae bacterium]
MLVRLMYASRAAAGLDTEEVNAILRRSRENNAREGITGALCLCATGRLFIQVLEGGRAAVNRRYNRIVADPRHTEATLLHYEEIALRRYAGWAMGHVNMARLNPAVVLKYSEQATLDPWAVSGAASAAMFDEMIASAAIMGK